MRPCQLDGYGFGTVSLCFEIHAEMRLVDGFVRPDREKKTSVFIDAGG
jgi:hypothetical protein